MNQGSGTHVLELRSKQVSAMMTPTEKQKLREAAARERLTVSALAGRILSRWLESESDQEEAQ